MDALTIENETDAFKTLWHAKAWPELERLCRDTILSDPRNIKAHRFLGFSIHQQDRTNEALQTYAKSASLIPDDPELLVNYCKLLLAQGRSDEALPHAERATQLCADNSLLWSTLAATCYETSHHKRGYAAADKALELARTPEERFLAFNQRAIHGRELGYIKQAVEDSIRGIEIAPDNVVNHTNRMLFMLADPDTTAHDIRQAAEAFSVAIEAPLRAKWASFADRNRDPWRRLKVGFLSPDLRMHSVMVFAEGLFANLDRRQFELFGFYLHPKQDYVTERVKKHLDHFIDVHHLSSESRWRCIQNHEIDILIDLAGHTAHHGLVSMAHKAAPIQASFIGFPGTTGLQSVDYFISDQVTDPDNAQADYVETLLRMPMRPCTYRPLSRNPLWRYQPAYQVQPAPALRNGYVTFGSCNNLGKVTDQVLRTWGAILNTVPGSKFLIEGKGFELPEFTQRYIERCRTLGIAEDRLILVPREYKNQYLTYHDVDIALDTFPMTGGATSLDVVWMGLPVVSMLGRSHMGRITAGVLQCLNRTEWLAQDEASYVAIASSLASDIRALNELRLGLRDAVEQSSLLRDELVCPMFGVALRSMWHRWVSAMEAPNDHATQDSLCEHWAQNPPESLMDRGTETVGIAPGIRVTKTQARSQLLEMLELAKRSPPPVAGQPLTGAWKAATEFAEHLLCAHPHDPIALTVLSEIEEHCGNLAFAVTYMQFATKALMQGHQPA
ncbi:acetylglucosamine transferase [Curvibacter sp. APW13]|uniref:O-linked N-acetylglucosamine transferase, SPINDLY family protein n=1 Tax=Curvibacter sp. APW13 TaxID=3077236 RepID=UPI0028DFA4FD|nr:tetratricopeptide repeat protein [Curvibacter sp. APW13]MDT8993012.1 acetylglucosamine transferase [Curvibacter sp. APW13]